MDWNPIKTEYITTDTSYRKLAKKYNIAYTTICNKSRQEGWIEQRKQFINKTVSKIIEDEATKQAERQKRILSVSDKLLTAIEKAVDAFLSEELVLDKGAIKQLTGAVKDIRDIQLIDDGADGSNEITVAFADETEDYSK